MTPRIDPTDPANMSPEECLAEVATVLAEGVLRLLRRQATAVLDAGNIHPVESVESAGNRRAKGARGNLISPARKRGAP